MIIGIRGKAGSGKTTASSHLVKQGWVKKAFAEKLKASCQLIFGLSHEQCYGALKEVVDPRWNRTPRDILQRVGEALRVNIDEGVWVRPVLEESVLSGVNIVIEDARYENEIVAILEAGGVIIDLKRKGHLSDTEAGQHASEVMVDLSQHKTRFPGRIHEIDNNNWSKDQLFEAVQTIVSDL